MKKLLLGITVLALILFASSAMAQDSSMKSGEVLAPTSLLGPVVGKLVSAYSDDTAFTTLAAYPTLTTVASTLVPAKYKSKTQWLVIQVTLQESCPSDQISSVVYVGGTPMYPDDVAAYAYECANSGGYETRTRTWFLPPENLGGPNVALGATVEVRATSTSGTASIARRSIIVQGIK
jgi:hypothetical protein